ncbi:MAG: potassium-tellurite ethidium and proflavin transporter [Gammaproteobacteria bacterium]|nr:potassium-tellurite ethidium and proflavin transporter [Gammaproteobacteria bacterium]
MNGAAATQSAQESANRRKLEQGSAAREVRSAAFIALASRPCASHIAQVLAALGIVGQLVFGVYRTGQLPDGQPRSDNDHSRALPAHRRGQFVSTIVLGAFGHPDWGAPFFGVGVPSWLAIESGLVQRLYTASELPPPLRPATLRTLLLGFHAIGGIAAGTVWLLLRGRLLPPPLQPPPESSTRRRGLYRIPAAGVAFGGSRSTESMD